MSFDKTPGKERFYLQRWTQGGMKKVTRDEVGGMKTGWSVFTDGRGSLALALQAALRGYNDIVAAYPGYGWPVVDVPSDEEAANAVA